WQVSPEEFAMLAAAALSPKTPPELDLRHLHAPVVSVREQAAILVPNLRGSGAWGFRALVADAAGTATVVARFLALLELFKEHVVAFEQAAPLADLTVRWTGAERGEVDLATDYDGEEST